MSPPISTNVTYQASDEHHMHILNLSEGFSSEPTLRASSPSAMSTTMFDADTIEVYQTCGKADFGSNRCGTSLGHHIGLQKLLANVGSSKIFQVNDRVSIGEPVV